MRDMRRALTEHRKPSRVGVLPRRPWDSIFIDLIQMKRGTAYPHCVYALIVVDMTTKFAYGFPLVNKTAANIVVSLAHLKFPHDLSLSIALAGTFCCFLCICVYCSCRHACNTWLCRRERCSRTIGVTMALNSSTAPSRNWSSCWGVNSEEARLTTHNHRGESSV